MIDKELSEASATVLRASGALSALMLKKFSAWRLDAMNNALAQGASIGIETKRLELARVAQADTPAPRVPQ
jgi:hypothetical protein